MAHSGLYVYGAANFFDVRLHYSHANAAAGDVGYLLRGGESGEEDQIEHFPLGHACRLFGGDYSALDCLLADAFSVQAGAIVADLDIDLPPFVKGAQNQASASSFARLHAHFGKFDAMIHGVAYQMGEWVLDRLDDGFVQFRLFALHLDAHFLAAAERHVTHGSRELAPDVSDGLHAGLHDFFLQFGGDEVQALGDGLKTGVFHSA